MPAARDPLTPEHARANRCTFLEWICACHAAVKRHPSDPFPQPADIELGKAAAQHLLPAYVTINMEKTDAK